MKCAEEWRAVRMPSAKVDHHSDNLVLAQTCRKRKAQLSQGPGAVRESLLGM